MSQHDHSHENKNDWQSRHEAELAPLLAKLGGAAGAAHTDNNWGLVRALVHQAVHLCADRKAGEYCALATLLAEMIGHAHAVMHPADQPAAHSGQMH